MVCKRNKLNELSKGELIEDLLSFDNLFEKINDLTKKMDDFATKCILFFQGYRFPEPIIHYANELLIWRDHPWIMLNN